MELAKDWRMDRYLRRLEAMLIVADAPSAVLPSPAMATCWEPSDGVVGHRLGRAITRSPTARALLTVPELCRPRKSPGGP